MNDKSKNLKECQQHDWEHITFRQVKCQHCDKIQYADQI